MTSVEIIALIVTAIGVICFALVFTLLYSSYINSSIESITVGKKDIELIDDELYERKHAHSKSRKIMNTVKNVIFYMLMVFLIPIFIFSMINKFQNSATMIGNNTVMVVASGSMSQKNEANEYLVTNNLNNQFNTYDIIVLSKVNSPYDLNDYDVIAYTNDEGVNVIHRIIRIEYASDGIRFITRGDSNNASDEYHPKFDDVIGKYTNKKIGAIGVFVIFFQSYPGIITIVATVYCLIMVSKLTNKVNKAQNERVEKLKTIIGDVSPDEVKELKIVYKEVIYFKDKTYYFNEQGIIESVGANEEAPIDVINPQEDSVCVSENALTEKEENGNEK